MSPDASRRPRRKWTLVAAFWAIQAVVFYLGSGLLPQYRPDAANRGTVWGTPTSSDAFDFGYLSEVEYIVVIAGSLAVIAFAQAVFLWPVRKPAPRARSGTPIWLSMTAAGLAVAILVGGLLAAAWDAVVLTGTPMPVLGEPVMWAIIAFTLLSWIVWTPLLMAFCARHRREAALQRLAARLFLGSVIEAAAVIPINVMIRRKTDCYCETGTFWTLCIVTAVGLFALGPAIFLPVLSRRRKRWYAGHCDACGYDMAGTLTADRCPECGVGWRPEAGSEPR